MTRALLITAAICSAAYAEEISDADARLTELYTAWTVDHSDTKQLSHVMWKDSSASVWTSCVRGRHELYQVLRFSTTRNIIDCDLKDVEALRETGAFEGIDLKRYLVNPKYAAIIQFDGRDSWTIERLAVKGAPSHAEVLRKCRAKSRSTKYMHGCKLGFHTTAEGWGWTGERDSTTEVFTYDKHDGSNTVTLRVDDGQFVSEIIHVPNEPDQIVTLSDGKLLTADGDYLFSKDYVKVHEEPLPTEECYLAFYGLEEPTVTAPVKFHTWWIGAGGVLLLGVGVVVQKLRGRPLLSG